MKLDFLADIDMLLMVEKDISRVIRHSIYRYDKNKEVSSLLYWEKIYTVAQCSESFQ